MINCIIISNNNPCRLQLLLDSLYHNSSKTFSYITILHNFNNEKFQKGYEILYKKHKNINWIEPHDFKKSVLEFLIKPREICNYSCFMTDEDIIYNEIPKDKIVNTLQSDEEVLGFTLSLGKNVTKCYMGGCDNVLIPLEEKDDIIKWDWTKHYFDFAFAFNLNATIYNTKEIYKLIKKISFDDIEKLEHGLQIFEDYPKYKMASFAQSKIVNVPVSIINGNGGISNGLIIEKYLNGETFDLSKIDFSNITGRSQELSLEFTNEIQSL